MKKEAVDAIVTGLKHTGINFVSMLPDSDFTDTQKIVMADRSFTYVPVSNEVIGFGVCAGACLGGKKPALLITTDGIMASAVPLTTLNMAKNIPAGSFFCRGRQPPDVSLRKSFTGPVMC